MTTEELSSTRLGRFINILRKSSGDATLAKKAKNLVKKWQKLIPESANAQSKTLQTNSSRDNSQKRDPLKLESNNNNNGRSETTINLSNDAKRFKEDDKSDINRIVLKENLQKLTMKINNQNGHPLIKQMEEDVNPKIELSLQSFMNTKDGNINTILPVLPYSDIFLDFS